MKSCRPEQTHHPAQCKKTEMREIKCALDEEKHKKKTAKNDLRCSMVMTPLYCFFSSWCLFLQQCLRKEQDQGNTGYEENTGKSGAPLLYTHRLRSKSFSSFGIAGVQTRKASEATNVKALTKFAQSRHLGLSNRQICSFWFHPFSTHSWRRTMTSNFVSTAADCGAWASDNNTRQTAFQIQTRKVHTKSKRNFRQHNCWALNTKMKNPAQL